MPEDNGLQMVKERLDVLIALEVSQIRKETAPKQLLAALANLGVSRPMIAGVVGMTVAAVSKALERAGKAANRSSTATRRGQGRRRAR